MGSASILLAAAGMLPAAFQARALAANA